MFDMMEMEENIDSISREDEDRDENNNDLAEDSEESGEKEQKEETKSKKKKKKKERPTLLREQERFADEGGDQSPPRESAPKRSLDTHLTKRHKVEPRKKRQAIDN